MSEPRSILWAACGSVELGGVNLKGAIYFARACKPAMVKGSNGGVICCIGSTSGFEGDAKGTMYGTAKSGLFTFVKGLALMRLAVQFSIT